MGCDGGTIPTRGELVRTKKKPEQVSKEADLVVKWQHCAISLEPLRKPMVACELGRLFNKESVIEFLLDKSNQETASKFEYIKGLKDIKELNLTDNPAFSAAVETANAGEDRKMAQYICPITGLEMNGRYRFCYLIGCGCVFAERALNEIKDGSCVKCGKTYLPEDVIPINGTEEDVEELRKQMDQRRLLAKEMRKSKKGKRSAAATTTNGVDGQQDDTASTSAAANDIYAPILKKQKLDVEDSLDSDQVQDSKVSKEAKSSSAKTVSFASEVVPRLVRGKSSSSGSKGSSHTKTDQSKKLLSIQDDPNASEAYKSLFSSHETAKRQPKAHWVTHNPLYF